MPTSRTNRRNYGQKFVPYGLTKIQTVLFFKIDRVLVEVEAGQNHPL